MEMTFAERELLTIDEAAEFTRLAKQTLYDYIHRRKVPYLKAGKRVLFRKSELDVWLNTGGNTEAAERIVKERGLKKRTA
jgi:excisionase family DNA binding protein